MVAGTNGITVSAGSSDIVVLRGLDIEGIGSGLDGVKFNPGAELRVEKCNIRGFLGAPGNGIHFAPTGTSQLFVLDTVIADNNKGSMSAGILIQPSGTGTASELIDGVKMLNSGNGLIVDGTQTTGNQMNIVLRNSAVSGNSFTGIQVVAAAGQTFTRVIISDTAVTTNTTGISSSGQGSDVTLAYAIVSGNTTGITFTAPGDIRSYQTNQLAGNDTTNGTPSSTIALQ